MKSAVRALLDEYERAILELKHTIKDISNQALTTIVNHNTTDANCKSIQTILSHVVSCAYNYACDIYRLKGFNISRSKKNLHSTVQEYIHDLTDVFTFTENVFHEIKDHELEQLDDALKIQASWGQHYDIEQMMEHAIVHILRHRRQIENFKIALQS